MAEVAASVLHNVGNALNSVMVSASVVSEKLRRSKIGNLGRAAELLRRHSGDLNAFLAHDVKGRELPAYLINLSEHLVQERDAMQREMKNLQEGLEHVRKIVARQQSYANAAGVTEALDVADVIEDALRMNSSSLEHHSVVLARDYAPGTPSIVAERHKVLQILVNLIRNGMRACAESHRPNKQIIIRAGSNDSRVQISISDNGVGIPPDNLVRIFNHGFSTWKGGHGFNLHSSALAAQEMGGTLLVKSDGPGEGSTFTLELPYSTVPSGDAGCVRDLAN
jgi:signal transduction histidine kinase